MGVSAQQHARDIVLDAVGFRDTLLQPGMNELADLLWRQQLDPAPYSRVLLHHGHTDTAPATRMAGEVECSSRDFKNGRDYQDSLSPTPSLLDAAHRHP